MAVLFLVVGLPGAGKTTRARALAREHAALRLTPDEWMIPLFHDNDADGMRDVVEGRLIWTAVEALRTGSSVVLDFGLWSRDERAALAWLARTVDAECTVVYLAVDRTTQLARIAQRWREAPHETYVITEADLDRWRAQFEEPDAAELGDSWAEDARRWDGWIATRWPTALG